MAAAGVNLAASIRFECLDPPEKWISHGQAKQTYKHYGKSTFWLPIVNSTPFGATSMPSNNGSWRRAGEKFGHHWQWTDEGKPFHGGIQFESTEAPESEGRRLGGGPQS